ncbi:hypothetical protein [Embleya sp. NPDC050493]|uniref:hypothetical protein n=1 Tax=Embleya sp. NPDC050493 TaxID=3363989 RepID=UPI0037AAEDD8
MDTNGQMDGGGPVTLPSKRRFMFLRVYRVDSSGRAQSPPREVGFEAYPNTTGLPPTKSPHDWPPCTCYRCRGTVIVGDWVAPATRELQYGRPAGVVVGIGRYRNEQTVVVRWGGPDDVWWLDVTEVSHIPPP